MSINYQFGDVDAHGALIRAQAASLEAEHQAIIRDVLAAGVRRCGHRQRVGLFRPGSDDRGRSGGNRDPELRLEHESRDDHRDSDRRRHRQGDQRRDRVV